MHHLRALGYGIARAASGLRREPLALSLVTGAIAVAFLLVGLAQLARSAVATATSSWTTTHMVVYLDEGTSPERAREINEVLAALPAVERSVYVAQEQALERLNGSLGEHGELVAGLEAGMLPASIEVTLRTGVDDVAATYPVVERLEAVPGVEEVEFAGAWVDRSLTVAAGLAHASWLFLVILGGACVYFVTTLVAARVEDRRKEAEVLRLLGASGAFVRGPVIVEGALQGVAGAGIAVVALWILFRLGGDAMGQALGGASLSFLSLQQIALLVAAGAALGAAGAWLATRALSWPRHATA